MSAMYQLPGASQTFKKLMSVNCKISRLVRCSRDWGFLQNKAVVMGTIESCFLSCHKGPAFC